MSAPSAGTELMLLSASGREALGEPFAYELTLLSESALDSSALLGRPAQIELLLADESVRVIHGIVCDFSVVGARGRHTEYQATLRPQLWLLGLHKNCRIFQGKSVTSVVEELFHEHDLTDFRFALSGSYPEREYLVQYRESDLDFVSRILEEAGIYYFFEHTSGRHVLVLADYPGAHEHATPGRALRYLPEADPRAGEPEHIDGWVFSRRIVPTRYSVSAFDFERQGSQPYTVSEERAKDGSPRAEVFDYPSGFLSPEGAEHYVRARLEEVQLGHEVARGAGNPRSLRCGYRFTLTGHPRDEQNLGHLVTETRYELRVDTHESVGAATGDEDCRCEFVAIDERRSFRPQRRTRKPVVDGPQTAIVVGPSGHEIWTDEYGRVKLKFHWDRFGTSTEASSCWVRVAQLWAGSGFGGIHVPRVGEEVIVDFLEGDPDRPIVVGRVYNADQRPPYELPAHQTRSGIKSRSTRDGSPENFNEIRFEDKRGQELVYVQAERDQTTLVKNDQTTTVAAKQTVTVGAEQTITVGTAQTLTVGAAQTIAVGAAQTTAVGAARSAVVGAADSTTVMGSRDTTVHGSDSLTARGPRTETFDAGRSVTVQARDTTTVRGGDKGLDVEGAYGVSANSFGVSSKSSIVLDCPSGSISAGSAAPGSAPGTPPSMLTLVATDALVLQCGENTIYITKEGISISSPNSVGAFVGDNLVALSPDEATLSGKKTTVSADGETDVMGSKVNLRRAAPRPKNA